MPTLGNIKFNWNASFLVQEYTRWHNTVKGNFKLNETKETKKASYI